MSEAGAVAEETPAEVATEPDAERLHGALVSWSRGQQVLHPTVDAYVDTVRALKDDGFVLCSDITAVDYLAGPQRDVPAGVTPERFEVVVNLTSMQPYRRVRVRVQVPESNPVVPTLHALHPGTEAPEREVYDMFGIRFDGHPDLTRILMPEDWEGHPLRKDNAVGRVPVQFKATQR